MVASEYVEVNDSAKGGAFARMVRACPFAGLHVCQVVFDKSNFNQLDFGEARFERVAFHNCDLSGANLQSCRLVDVDFAGSDLSGAKLPDGALAFSTQLKQVEEISKGAQQALFVFLGLSAYVAMTVLSLKDGDLLGSTVLISLPVIQKTLTARAFYLVAPLVSAAMCLYVLLGLHATLKAISRLPAIFPEGICMREKIYPAVINRVLVDLIVSGEDFRQAYKERRLLCGALSTFAVAALVWLPAPAVAGLGVWRVARIHDESLSSVTFSLFLLACVLTAASMRGIRLLAQREGARQGGAAQWVAVVLLAFLAAGWLRAGHLQYLGPLNLRRQDLAAADLHGLHLENADLTGTDLHSADLSGAFLRGAVFRSATLDGARLTSADLSQADFTGASAIGADLTHATLSESKFENAILDNAILSSVHAESNCGFVGASLKKARMGIANDAPNAKTTLEGADFSNADLTGISMTGAVLQEAQFMDTALDGAILSNTRLDGANFARAKLPAAHLSGVTLKKAVFSDAMMEGIVVDGGCDFTEALLSNVQARKAKLAGVMLAGADLHAAILSGSILRGANLSGAKLQLADLSGADLSGSATNLKSAVLIGADFSDAILGGGKFDEAVVDSPNWMETLKSLKLPPRDLTNFIGKWRVAKMPLYGGQVDALVPRQ